MVVTGKLGAGREGSVTTLDGVEEVDDVTGVVSAGGGVAGAERLRTQRVNTIDIVIMDTTLLGSKTKCITYLGLETPPPGAASSVSRPSPALSPGSDSSSGSVSGLSSAYIHNTKFISKLFPLCYSLPEKTSKLILFIYTSSVRWKILTCAATPA